MCKAFSCLVTQRGKVYWKSGLDSHEDILNLYKKDDKDLQDNKEPPYNTFARIELVPHDGNYLNLIQEWDYSIDESIKPSFLDSSSEFICKEALDKWKKEVYTFNLKEAVNPVNPFKINPPKITKKHLLLLKQWASVRASVRDSVWASVRDYGWDSVRASVWDSVWDSVRASVWDSVWDYVGASVGASVWASVGASVGDYVRDSVWASVRDYGWASVRGYGWASVRDSVWASVRDSVWAYYGSLFQIKKWEYIDYDNILFRQGKYPFESAEKLWRLGLVPSFNGKTWILHGEKGAKILWEGTIDDIKE